ncbi:winged helix-turn-helix transcriptional regulator [Nonomuraea sp. NPDC049152]|uniref:winged helix-turn-helix transcriptional regulator n=1 Tax=Nonomuraea sp. NPDC049152 TaxID=3154350 RepID=UPI0033E119FD
MPNSDDAIAPAIKPPIGIAPQETKRTVAITRGQQFGRTGRLPVGAGHLVAHGVLEKRPYSDRPPRHDYLLTAKGEGLLPALIALQDWGTRHVMGDGALTATSEDGSAVTRRVHELVNRKMPDVVLERHDGEPVAPNAPGGVWTVLYFFPGTFAPGSIASTGCWPTTPRTTASACLSAGLRRPGRPPEVHSPAKTGPTR